MERNSERGAIVVEATISFTAFIFALVMVLMIVNMAYAQAKIGSALNYATKELSQYSYLYFKLGVDEMDANLSAGTEDAKEQSKKTVDSLVTFTGKMTDATESAQEYDFDGMLNSLESGATDVNTLYNSYKEQISKDPKGFAMSMGKLAVSETKETAKVYLAQLAAKALMEKNLKSAADEDPEGFLNRMHIVSTAGGGEKKGLDALDFGGSYMLPAGKNSIQLVCTYEIKVLKLLNIDYTFKITQCARTNAWGSGVSEIEPQSIWDLPDSTARGKMIVANEKKNFPYESTGKKYDAYNNKNGKNEFVTIFSIDNITYDTYKTQSGVNDRVKKEFRAMYNSVKGMPEDITVTKNGENVTQRSDPATRTYRLVIVVPDSGDQTMVKKAVENLKSLYPDVTIEYEIKTGYGDPKVEQQNDSSGSSNENAA